MELARAYKIVNDMAKLRANTPADVIVEYGKYQVDGKVQHFWPDENTAVQVVIEDMFQTLTKAGIGE